jgi:glucose/mannose-6-phosphate isomerase
VASDLTGGLAVVHTAGDEAHGAGLRLGAQLNENAKVPALVAAYPELDHNALVGWDAPCPATGGPVEILLRSASLAAALERRILATAGLLQPAFRARHTVRASGEGTLARILSLVQWGDALSWHLARLRGVDPVPVTRIEELKQALARGRDAADEE